jgi:hypothetical protein
MHDQRANAVVTHTSARVLGERHKYAEAQVVLRYERSDPYAVVVTVTVPRQSAVVWLLARDLFFDGLGGLAGKGDATVGPAPANGAEKLHLTLRNGLDRAVVELHVDVIVDFLRNTDALVRRGHESRHIDIDGELTQLLAD